MKSFLDILKWPGQSLILTGEPFLGTMILLVIS